MLILFPEVDEHNAAVWFTLDYVSDFVYLLDIGVHLRMGYLEDGVLQTDGGKLRRHYMNSWRFYVDCLCLLPLDLLYLVVGVKSLLRCLRSFKEEFCRFLSYFRTQYGIEDCTLP